MKHYALASLAVAALIGFSNSQAQANSGGGEKEDALSPGFVQLMPIYLPAIEKGKFAGDAILFISFDTKDAGSRVHACQHENIIRDRLFVSFNKRPVTFGADGELDIKALESQVNGVVYSVIKDKFVKSTVKKGFTYVGRSVTATLKGGC